MQRPHPSLLVRRFHPATRHTWTAHLRRTTSWVAAGSAAAALALIGVAAHETPPHRTTGSTGSSGATGSTSTGSAGGTTTAGEGPERTGGDDRASTIGSSTTGAVTSGRSSTSGSVIGPSSGGTAHVSTGMS